MGLIKKHIILFGTIAVFVVSFSFYMLVLSSFGITFNGTANGAYKAVHFHEWLNGHGYIEKANALYYPMLQFISFVFALKTPLEIYYGIVALNGFFSSVLLAFLFRYFSGYLQSLRLGLLVAAVHFMTGGYFTLSTNNEDIFPAYTFFVIGILLLKDFLQSKALKKLVFSITALTLSALIHWTIGVPTCIALVLFLLFCKSYSWMEKLNYLLISFGIALLLFSTVSVILHIPLSELVYPAKEVNSLWVSHFEPQKVLLCIYNIPFFIFNSATTINNYSQSSLGVLFYCSLLLLVMILGMIRLLKLRKKTGFADIWQGEKLFLSILLLISLLGFGMNIYEQGSDHQFMTQPCFVFVYAFAFCLRLSQAFKLGTKRVLVLVAILMVFFGLAVNRVRGRDDQYFNQFNVVNAQVDFEKTVFIGIPFRVFHVVAQLKLENPSDYHNIFLPSENHGDYLLSEEDYVEKYKAEIRKYEKAGYQVVLINILNQSSEEAGNIFVGYDLSGKIERMKQYFKSNYAIQRTYVFDEVGATFYFLKRKKASSLKF